MGSGSCRSIQDQLSLVWVSQCRLVSHDSQTEIFLLVVSLSTWAFSCCGVWTLWPSPLHAIPATTPDSWASKHLQIPVRSIDFPAALALDSVSQSLALVSMLLRRRPTLPTGSAAASFHSLILTLFVLPPVVACCQGNFH